MYTTVYMTKTENTQGCTFTVYITFNRTDIHITVCGILIARNRIHRFYCWLCLQITVWCHYDIKKKTRLSLSLYLLYDVMKVHYCNMNHYSKCTVQCTLFVYIPVLSTNVWMIVNMVHKSDPYFIRSVSIYMLVKYTVYLWNAYLTYFRERFTIPFRECHNSSIQDTFTK